MGVPSCSGFECVLFAAAVGMFLVVAAGAAVLEGLSAVELVRVLSSRTGLQRWDLPIRIAAFLAAVWQALRGVGAMDDLGLVPWLTISAGSLVGLTLLAAWLRRVNRSRLNRP